MSEDEKGEAKRGRVGLKQALCYWALTCFTFLLVAFVCICFSIRSSVKEIGAQAVLEFSGDRVEALMKYVESTDHSLRQRNRAVWALGQIGDKRALPMLERYRTAKPCDHDTTLCQREVEQAIEACKGAFNATAWLPR